MCLTDVFKLDPDFLENEEKYKTIKRGENKLDYIRPAVKSSVLLSDQFLVTS